jgi:hypothetical protein
MGFPYNSGPSYLKMRYVKDLVGEVLLIDLKVSVVPEPALILVNLVTSCVVSVIIFRIGTSSFLPVVRNPRRLSSAFNSTTVISRHSLARALLTGTWASNLTVAATDGVEQI